MVKECYSVKQILHTPQPISSLSFGSDQHIFAGSDDGSLRVYHVSSNRVLKAIRGLRSEILSVVSLKNSGSEIGVVWLACGRRVLSFDMDSPKMVSTLTDAISNIEVGEDEEDVVNELTLSLNMRFLAFGSDSGTVGVVDISTEEFTRMKTKHDNICGTVKFIPDRPSELLSGGYDLALLHFDFVQGSLLSRYDFTSLPPSSGVSLSPPFIQCTSLSASGILAAGTADGRLWIGGGGEKRRGVKKKRSRKWEGLNRDETFCLKIAEGPIIGIAFLDLDTLMSCTLLGTVSLHRLSRDPLQLDPLCSRGTDAVEKVNALAVDGQWLTIGGFDEDGKGVIELWNRNVDVTE